MNQNNKKVFRLKYIAIIWMLYLINTWIMASITEQTIKIQWRHRMQKVILLLSNQTPRTIQSPQRANISQLQQINYLPNNPNYFQQPHKMKSAWEKNLRKRKGK